VTIKKENKKIWNKESGITWSCCGWMVLFGGDKRFKKWQNVSRRGHVCLLFSFIFLWWLIFFSLQKRITFPLNDSNLAVQSISVSSFIHGWIHYPSLTLVFMNWQFLFKKTLIFCRKKKQKRFTCSLNELFVVLKKVEKWTSFHFVFVFYFLFFQWKDFQRNHYNNSKGLKPIQLFIFELTNLWIILNWFVQKPRKKKITPQKNKYHLWTLFINIKLKKVEKCMFFFPQRIFSLSPSPFKPKLEFNKFN